MSTTDTAPPSPSAPDSAASGAAPRAKAPGRRGGRPPKNASADAGLATAGPGAPAPAAAAASAPRSAAGSAPRAAKAPPAPPEPNPDLVTRWSGKGWHAEVVVAEDGEGWAVELRRDGDEDPVLVSPWTMGRNKKDPKPLNEPDFAALVKAARDFLSRAEAQARAATRKMLQITDAEGAPIKVIFEMVGDEDEPRGLLRALDSAGQTLAQEEVEPSFPFQRPRLEAWARRGFGPL